MKVGPAAPARIDVPPAAQSLLAPPESSVSFDGAGRSATDRHAGRLSSSRSLSPPLPKPPRPPRAAARTLPPPIVDDEPSVIFSALVTNLSTGLNEACQALLSSHGERPPPMRPGHWADNLWRAEAVTAEREQAALLCAEPLAKVMALQRQAVLGIELELIACLGAASSTPQPLSPRLSQRLVRAFSRQLWTSWRPLKEAIRRVGAPLSNETAERLVEFFCVMEPNHPELITAAATASRHLVDGFARSSSMLGPMQGLAAPERKAVALTAVGETLLGLERKHRGMAMRLLRTGGPAMLIHAPGAFAQLHRVLLRPWSSEIRRPLERVLSTVLSAPVDGGSRRQLHEHLSLNMWLTTGLSLIGDFDEPTLRWFDSALGRLFERLGQGRAWPVEPDLLFFALAALRRIVEHDPTVASGHQSARFEPGLEATDRKQASLRQYVEHALFFIPRHADTLQAAEIVRLIARLHGPDPRRDWPALCTPLVGWYERSEVHAPEALNRFIEQLALLEELDVERRQERLTEWLQS